MMRALHFTTLVPVAESYSPAEARHCARRRFVFGLLPEGACLWVGRPISGSRLQSKKIVQTKCRVGVRWRWTARGRGALRLI